MSTLLQRIWSKIFVILGVTDTTKHQRMIQDLVGVVASEIFEALSRQLPEAQKAQLREIWSSPMSDPEDREKRLALSHALFREHLDARSIQAAATTATSKIFSEYIAAITRRASREQKQKVSSVLRKLAIFPRARLSF